MDSWLTPRHLIVFVTAMNFLFYMPVLVQRNNMGLCWFISIQNATFVDSVSFSGEMVISCSNNEGFLFPSNCQPFSKFCSLLFILPKTQKILLSRILNSVSS